MPIVTGASAVANETSASNNDTNNNPQQRKNPNKPKPKRLTKEHAAVKLKSSLIELNQDITNLNLAITHMSKICKGQSVPPVLRDMKGCLDRMQTVQNSLKDDVLPVLACEWTVDYLYSRMRWEARKNRREEVIRVVLGKVFPEEKEVKSNKRKRGDLNASSTNLPSLEDKKNKSEVDIFEKIQCIAPEAPILQLPTQSTSKKSKAETKSCKISPFPATTSSQVKKQKPQKYTIFRPQIKTEFGPEEAMQILLKTSCRNERMANIREWVLRRYIAVDGVHKTEELFQNYRKSGIIEDEWHKVPSSYRCKPLLNANKFPTSLGPISLLVPVVGTAPLATTLPIAPTIPEGATVTALPDVPNAASSITATTAVEGTIASSVCTTTLTIAEATTTATPVILTTAAASIDTAASALSKEIENSCTALKDVTIIGNHNESTTTTPPRSTTNGRVESTGLTNVPISASTASNSTSTLRLAQQTNPILKMAYGTVPPSSTLLSQYARMRPTPPTTFMVNGKMIRIFHPVNGTEFHPQEAMFILSKLPKPERAANMKEWVEKKQIPIKKSLLYKKFRKHLKGHDIGESWYTKPGRPIGVTDSKPRVEARKPSIRKSPVNLQLIKPPDGEQQFDFMTALESLSKMDDKNRVANMKYWCEKNFAPIPLSTFNKKYRRFNLGQDVGNDWFKKPGRPPLFTNEQFEKMIKEEQSKKGPEKLSRNELKQILNDRCIQMSQEKGRQAHGSYSVGSGTIKNYMNLAGIHDVIVKLNKPPKQRYWSRRKKVPNEPGGTEELNPEHVQHDDVPHFDNFHPNESGMYFE